jgi:hypothetical protein
VENVERIALEAYQNSPSGELADKNVAISQKGHHRRHSKSKNILNFSPTHSSSSANSAEQQQPASILTTLAKDNFAGGAGCCAETVSWKAAIFKVIKLFHYYTKKYFR